MDPHRQSIKRRTLETAYGGLALTMVTIVVLYAAHLGGNVLAEHIRSGYPSYSASDAEAAATTYVIYLTVLGALGVISWLITVWSITADKRWARWLASALFVAGTTIALFDLTVRDTSGDTGIPPILGWIGLLPSLAGLIVVILLWRTSLARK